MHAPTHTYKNQQPLQHLVPLLTSLGLVQHTIESDLCMQGTLQPTAALSHCSPMAQWTPFRHHHSNDISGAERMGLGLDPDGLGCGIAMCSVRWMTPFVVWQQMEKAEPQVGESMGPQPTVGVQNRILLPTVHHPGPRLHSTQADPVGLGSQHTGLGSSQGSRSKEMPGQERLAGGTSPEGSSPGHSAAPCQEPTPSHR